MIATMEGIKQTNIIKSFSVAINNARDFSTPEGQRIIALSDTFMSGIERDYKELLEILRSRFADKGFKVIRPEVEAANSEVYFSVNKSTIPMSSFKAENNSKGMMSDVFNIIKEVVNEFSSEQTEQDQNKILKDILSLVGISDVRENEIVLLYNFEQ